MALETEQQNEDLIEQIARSIEARKRGDAPEPAAEPPAPEPQAPVADAAPAAPPEQPGTPAGAPVPAPAATAEPEPFPGYGSLAPEIREQVDRLRTEAAEKAQLQQNYMALHNRLAPIQRAYDTLRQQVDQGGTQSQRPAGPPPILPIEQWFKRQSPERQQYFRQYPEEATAAYEIARDLLSEQTAYLHQTFSSEIADIKMDAEIRHLTSAHPDWAQYRMAPDPATGRPTPVSREAEDYWGWVAQQSPEVQRKAQGNNATAISEVLGTYKWERSNPEYRETLGLPEFQAWTTSVPRRMLDLINSDVIDDRRYVLAQFWRDYDEATAARSAGRPANPEAQRAQDIAARRATQAQRITPSPRSTVAPASQAAGTGGSEDAAIESVYQLLKARRA